MDLERAFLSKILEAEDLTPVWDAHINSSFFEDDEHLLIWKWLTAFNEKYGKCPGVDALQAEYPAYKLAEANEPIDYYTDRLRERRQHNILVEVVESAVDSLEDRRSDEALKTISYGVQTIYEEVTSLSDEDVTQTGDQRLAYYEELSSNEGGMVGFPTGFKAIDYATGGMQPEQLVTFIGPAKAGKSTMMLYMALAAHAAGATPMFVSFEMSTREQTMRMDSMLGGVNYNHILHGKLTIGERKRIRTAHKEFALLKPMIFVHDIAETTTLGALQAKVAQHKPDIVFVDGAYHMEIDIPGVEPESPQALTWLTRNMKRTAQRLSIPIVISTQALGWKISKKRGLTQDSVGYSSSFAQDSDLILGVLPDDQDTSLVTVSIVSARTAVRMSIGVRRIWEEGKIEEMAPPDPSDAGDDMVPDD